MAELPAPPLLDLPTELQLIIIDKLDYPSRLSLSQTNKYLRSSISIQPPSTPQQRRQYLCDKETWPGYQEYFACSRCLQLLHYSRFTSGQVRGRHAKLCSGRYFRVCIDCKAHEGFERDGNRDHDHNLDEVLGQLVNVGLRSAQAMMPIPPHLAVHPPNPTVPPPNPAVPYAHPTMAPANPTAPPGPYVNYYNGYRGSYSPWWPYYPPTGRQS
ncbi:hypothetical protein BDV36DRAFT_231402 [Aspergillus pseudocaelatus]|uniref:F-box domain-containing protein n=1 Tax=Aspergillus pseudocaelatus TaxID=1825620 RepID=A0ABQ6X0I9_9EURO|nr:hypothetical protein BDV36DRAFT_231402 [Aspergillus pseudocaelatus]